MKAVGNHGSPNTQRTGSLPRGWKWLLYSRSPPECCEIRTNSGIVCQFKDSLTGLQPVNCSHWIVEYPLAIPLALRLVTDNLSPSRWSFPVILQSLETTETSVCNATQLPSKKIVLSKNINVVFSFSRGLIKYDFFLSISFLLQLTLPSYY